MIHCSMLCINSVFQLQLYTAKIKTDYTRQVQVMNTDSLRLTQLLMKISIVMESLSFS